MGKTSEAQKRAVANYQKRGSIKRVELAFGPSEQDLYEHVQAQPNKMGYIKGLIRKDMQGGE